MNCKQGDLAIVIQTHPGNEEAIGHIVKIVRPSVKYKNSWVIQFLRQIFDLGPYGVPVLKDAYLRPVSGLPMEEDVRDEIKEKA